MHRLHTPRKDQKTEWPDFVSFLLGEFSATRRWQRVTHKQPGSDLKVPKHLLKVIGSLLKFRLPHYHPCGTSGHWGQPDQALNWASSFSISAWPTPRLLDSGPQMLSVLIFIRPAATTEVTALSVTFSTHPLHWFPCRTFLEHRDTPSSALLPIHFIAIPKPKILNKGQIRASRL